MVATSELADRADTSSGITRHHDWNPLGEWNPAERFVGLAGLVSAGFVAALAPFTSARIEWNGYAIVALGALALLVAGQLYRQSGRSDRIGDTLVAAGLFLVFPVALSFLNHLFLPHGRETVDGALAWIDSFYGFHHPDWVAWAGAHPFANEAARVAYNSSLVQIAALVLVLGFSGRCERLGVFQLILAVAGILTVAIWVLLPTNGVGTVHPLPPEVEALARPTVTNAYAFELERMAREGPALISHDAVKGLISLPSYHTIMACACAWAAWGVRVLRWPFVLLNLVVLYGTIVHGGHHMIDLPAGMAVFAVSLLLARRIARAPAMP